MEKLLTSNLINRADVANALTAAFVQGGDEPTLLAVAVSLGVSDYFLNNCRRLEKKRVKFTLGPISESP